MLERTAGCLETGSLRRLLPGSPRPLKVRRMLHSTFWNHGAIELEHSPLWMALIRGPESVVDEHNEKCVKSVSNASAGGFLDFLYPGGAIRLIRRYSLWKYDTQEIQRARAGVTRSGQRSYTSGAVEGQAKPVGKDLVTSEAEAEEDNHTASTTCNQLSDSKRYNPLLSLKDLNDTPDYDGAWRQLKMIDSAERKQFISQLLEYVSTSNRRQDAEQAASLFVEIRGTARPEEYRWVIQLQSNVGGFQSAMDLCYEALKKFDVPIGWDILFAHTLRERQWQIACDVGIAFRRFRRERPPFIYNLWGNLDKVSGLSDRAIELAGFVREELDRPSDPRIRSEAVFFTADFIVRVLLNMSDKKTLEPSKFNTLVDLLQHWDADTEERYEQFISRLLDSGHTKLGIRCYRKYRQRTTKKMSRSILDKVLKVACKYQSILGMQQVLDDWFRFYGTPSSAAYRLFLGAFARQGDVNTVMKLFDQYIAKRGGKKNIRTADDIAPLLHVHAKRGELSKVIKIFDGIEEEHGVVPTIKCWNILIDAYGKVQDVDGAFTQFQRLLNSSVRPDDYTYGTLMGICVTRGDLYQALEFYRMAESQGVTRTAVMIDCLVHLYIQDDRLLEAEQLCNDALAMDFRGPLTRMWNYLLVAYAMRRDLETANRILHRMSKVGVDYDSATYAAIMQALAMVKQPKRAYDILKNVMPEAGMKVTSFHYAVVMGGYIATGELHKVFQLHNQMLRRNLNRTVSTQLMTLKASVMKEQRDLESISQEEQLAKAEQLFYDAYSTPNAEEIVDSMRKGIGNIPLDVAYPSSYFGYLIFVLGQQKSFHRAIQLYGQYIDNIPEHRREELPLKIISGMMAVNLQNNNYGTVQELWRLAFETAKKQGLPVRLSGQPESSKVLPIHQQALSRSLSIQITSLSRQGDFVKLIKTKKDIEEAGFVLDNKNWNLYIQCLVIGKRYKPAFECCEVKLMGGWTGWARLRWKEPVRNRLATKIRYSRRNKQPILLRPLQGTLLYLGKAYIEIQENAAESQQAKEFLNYIESRCTRTVNALRTMQRADDEMERAILGF